MKNRGLIIFFRCTASIVIISASQKVQKDDVEEFDHENSQEFDGLKLTNLNKGSYRVYSRSGGKWITKEFLKEVESASDFERHQESSKFRVQSDGSSDDISGDFKVGQRVNGWGRVAGPEDCARDCIADAQPKICYYDWTVESYRTLGGACDFCVPKTNSSLTADCQCIYGDGYNISGITTVNRMFPGPSIQVCLGDLVVVDVTNNIDGNQLTIHWHGIYQHSWQHYDGVPFVTQCPILSRTTFRYQWRAQNIGTHWWHSHAGIHQAKMLAGMIVIRQPKEDDNNHRLYDRDDVDNHIFLSDWMHTLPEQHFPGAAGPPFAGQTPDNILINGQGQWLDPATKAFTNTPLAVINVEPGLRYRFRMVNTGTWNCPMQLTIQDHNLTIIAADGENIRPVIVNTITSFPAERFDFVLNANKKSGTYWIQVRLVGYCLEQKIIQLGFLRYSTSSSLQPQLARPTFDHAISTGIVLNNINEVCDGTNLNAICVKNLQAADPVDPRILAKKTDLQFFLPFTFYTYNKNELYKTGIYHHFLDPFGLTTGNVPSINGITNVLPTSPLLTQSKNIPQSQICEGSKKPKKCLNNPVCQCTHILRIPLNASVEIIMFDESRKNTGKVVNLSHPYHLHGHGFHVMAQGSQHKVNLTLANKHKALQLDREMYKMESYSRPVLKDTIAVPSHGYTIVRFIANNPGYWLYHCHVLPHSMTGMSLVFQVGGEKDVLPAPTGFPTCGNFHPPISSSYGL